MESNASAAPLRWPAVAAAIVFNLIPIIGVVVWGWGAFALIFLYWIENLVVGVRTLANMAATGLVAGGASLLGVVFLGAFFTLHCGLFCFVHGVFVVTMFGGAYLGQADSLIDLGGVAQVLFAREPGLGVGLASIALWQGVQFVLFLARGEARSANLITLMGAPYPRVLVLHMTIFLGGALLMLLSQPMAGIVALALLKAGFDVAEALGKGVRIKSPAPLSQ